jgi:Ser/Thr protein kinase RdoA (MazF antagonist)
MTRVSPHPYDRLTPDVIIAAVESLGYVSDRRILALNSYENRVYQVGVERGAPLVVKFYRPQRWSTAAIVEEHGFALELAAAEFPWCRRWCRTAARCSSTTGSAFARVRAARRTLAGARHAHRARMDGRFLGRIHLIGSGSASVIAAASRSSARARAARLPARARLDPAALQNRVRIAD